MPMRSLAGISLHYYQPSSKATLLSRYELYQESINESI